MKKLFTMLACMMIFITASAKDPEVTDIAMVGKGVGNANRPTLLVTCAAKKADKVTDLDLCRCAVRGILFQGWTDDVKTGGYETSAFHPALTSGPDAEVEHADFFNDFFSSGDVTKYATVLPDTRKVVKNGKVFHVSGMVTVNVPALRKKLESSNIIKTLKSGW